MSGPVLRQFPRVHALLRCLALVLSFGLALLAAARVPAEPGRPDPQPPSREVAHERAPDADLLREWSATPEWLALLHQSRRGLGRETREAMFESGFFLSPHGLPKEELEATLAAFASGDPDSDRNAHCRFPARHRWAADRGLVDPDRGVCPELDAWLEGIGDFELTLVFPEAFLGNPASMFGHTLLRFDPVGGPSDASGEPLLGLALDYTADAEGDGGALYLMRGLLGGYRGRFSFDPYYEKIKVYSDWQDRDIWEYPFAMSAPDRELLVLHIWELRDVALPYYFFTQNCSEKLLELLEVVEPGLGRGGGFPPAVAPVDTVRAIEHGKDPLDVPTLRISPATRLQRVMAGTSVEASRVAERLADGSLAPDDRVLTRLPAHEQARILEVAYDLLRHRYLAGKIDDESSRTRSRMLLLARSRLGLPRETEADASANETLPSKRPPDSGHGTARVGLGGGIQDRDGFLELHVQPAYHDLLDAPGGYAEGGQIRVLDTRVRYFPELDRVRLHELVLLDIVTASPWRRPFRPLAWRFDLGLRTRLLSSDRGRGLDTEGVFRIQGGVGAASAPARDLLLYGFGELVLESGPGLEGDVALGPVARAGLTWSSPEQRVSVQLEGLAGLLTGPQTSPWLRVELSQRTTLTEKCSLVVSGFYERAYDVGYPEGRVGLVRYF